MGTQWGPALSAEAVLGVVDAAYDVDRSPEAWVAGIAEASLPLLDARGGVHGFAFDHESEAMVHPCLAGGRGEWQAMWRATWWDGFMRHLPPGSLRAMLAAGRVAHTNAMWASAVERQPRFAELLRDRAVSPVERDGAAAVGFGYPESLNIVGLDLGGGGIVLCANRSEVARRPITPCVATILERLAGHLAAASRLRGAAEGRDALMSQADAILDTRGKLVHATGEARERVQRAALRAAALDVLRARSRRTKTPEEALELWRALFAGRYSLVEVFDRDGRRHLVARANVPPARTAEHASGPALSEREERALSLLAMGCSNKLAAYELGVSPSTVSTHLRSAARKLGVRSSAELVRAARSRAEKR